MTIDTAALRRRGYDLTPMPLSVRGFHSATRVGDLVFTSGQIPLIDGTGIVGKVGGEVDLPTARRAAEMCAVNCLRAAIAVAQEQELGRVVKVFGMVNVAPGFTDTAEVIDAATEIFNAAFPGRPPHARSAVGMVLPADWAVEVEAVFAVEAPVERPD